MHPSKTVVYLFLTILLLTSAVMLNAKNDGTGVITGTITDKKTGDPVVGASVLLVGTKLGAMTDFDGKYIINEVTPGSYTVQISHLEYTLVKIEAVSVQATFTTEVNYELEKKVNELGVEITVRDKPDILDKFTVSNEISVRAEADVLSQAPAGPARKAKGGGVVYYESSAGYYPPAHGGNAIVNGEAFDAMFFKNYGVNPFVDTEDDHLSTFATDVDDASYIMTRSYLERGALPPNEAVRTEEFINHFDYNYTPVYNKTFGVYIEGAPSRFGQNCQLLKIGIKGMEIEPSERKDANLVFVIDISGSMGREDRLGLVRKALRMLVDELGDNDRVGIVVYGSIGQVRLEPTSIANKERIIREIERLTPHGSTNAEEGLRLGYDMADRMFEKGKINRIILCSDGVANVGRTGPDAILKQIKQYADKGITLSSIGFGMGNYNDILLEKLGNKGNGSYAYVDDIKEAKRVFVDNLTGNLQVIARDVKIQVDFNPDVVRSYRLLGYENRDVDDNKFRDDKEDGGEVGSGHEVTALYEVKFKDYTESDHVGTVYIRYKDPDELTQVTEINENISMNDFLVSFDNCSDEFKLAATVAEFAEILRKSYWAKGSKPEDVIVVAKQLFSQSERDDLIEFISLVSKTRQFEEELAQK